jgi:hypothetical protein
VVPVLVESLPIVARALLRRKIGREAIGHPYRARAKDVRGIFEAVEARPERRELNLYVSGYDDEPGSVTGAGAGGGADAAPSAPGPNPRRLRRP